MKIRCSPTPVILLAISFLTLLTVKASADKPNANSSAAFTSQAWKALNAQDYRSAIAAATKCIELYKEKAEAQQNAMGHTGDKEGSWALNDVATCYFIRGKAKEGAQQIQEAIEDYKFVSEHLTKAECKDEKGKWSPAQVAKKRLLSLENPDAATTSGTSTAPATPATPSTTTTAPANPPATQ